MQDSRNLSDSVANQNILENIKNPQNLCFPLKSVIFTSMTGTAKSTSRKESPLQDRSRLKRFALLSIAIALITMGLKLIAYLLTDSVGLLSDAIESLVNLAGALMAFWMLTIAARPEDRDHSHGHSKAEYFSSGTEGTLILVAAIAILIAAIERFNTPRPLEEVGLGLAVSSFASLLNLGTALLLLRAGRHYRSITLEANGKHLMADVWTTGGVLVGVGLVSLTGWNPLDPIIACVVALNIVRIGITIVRQSVLGLMDTSLPPEEETVIQRILETYAERDGIQFHAFRTRQAGARKFISFHVLVPGSWTVHQGHGLLEQIEADIRNILPESTLLTHLESLDDPSSWADVTLDRNDRREDL